MSSPRMPATTANASLDAAIGNPANNGRIRVYNGTQPANGGGAITTQTLLMEFVLPADAFPAASGGVLTANAIPAVAAVASGIPTWYRLVKSDLTTILLDGDVGVAASPDNPDLVIDSASVTSGDVVAVVQYRITQPLQ